MVRIALVLVVVFFFQAEDGIRGIVVTGVQTCALPISVATLGSVCARVTLQGSKTAATMIATTAARRWCIGKIERRLRAAVVTGVLTRVACSAVIGVLRCSEPRTSLTRLTK